MAKQPSSVYVCSSCGYETNKWLGRCSDCSAWNTMTEQAATPIALSKSGGRSYSPSKTARIHEISSTEDPRFSSGLAELDRVLGGGIVKGSLVLVGGEPGIGKSTLLLQICQTISGAILYVSGEESAKQIKIRADRLSINNPELSLLCETNIEDILSAIQNLKPRLVIIDSIQTMYTDALNSSPGSVSQVREATHALMKMAKNMGICIFIVGHVTKEGALAGPRVLEHMVDCVLYFEGERHHSFRVIRAVKNRFGSTNEIGVFDMQDCGLIEVSNPSLSLISQRPENASGSAIICTMEGTRPLLVEIQALVTPTYFAVPRRSSTGADIGRVNLLMAVLEKRQKISLQTYDAYINVAGGLKITEPAADVGIALSIISNFKDIVINDKIVVFGEIGLSGEIRSVSRADLRVKEAQKLGFEHCIVPYDNYTKLKDKSNITGVKTLSQAITCICKK